MLIYRIIVKSALRKYIKPEFEGKGFIVIDYKWPGLLSNGDFQPEDITLTVMNKNGKASNSFFAYIFYNDGNEIKKITARIDTTFWTIDKVFYSSKL